MNIPKLKKIKTTKNYHGIPLEDDYSWVDQPNILEVLKDPKKLNTEVKDYIEANNKITEDYFTDVKELQKNLFNEIKGKIKLDDTGLKYKDKRYYYWSKTEAKGNYGKRMRQLIDGSKSEEVYFDGDLEKKKSGSEYFGVGTVSTSYCDNFIAYSLDLKGSEYYTIYLRDLRTGKNEKDVIENTSGSVTWALDNKSFFYSKLDQYHRPRQIFKHVLGTSTDQDQLIFEEKDETFTCGIGITSDEKYFIIGTSDHITTEEYFFSTDAKEIKPTLFQKRKNDVRYSIDSWQGYFYVHTNEEARDYKELRCKTDQIEKLEVFIPAKKETVIGGFEFLDDYIIRSEKSDAIPKLFVRNIQTNKEEEIKISDEPIGVPGVSLMQRDTNTTMIRVGWESMATPGQVYEYDIVSKQKKLVKQTEVQSGHDPSNYVVERIKAESHDGQMIPIS